jgi:spermidine/putrescine transport system ATP-binding protein
MAEVVLELSDLTKRFGAVLAVDGVSERLVRGEYVCLLGPSGCGKTTLLRLIAGFEQPDGGRISLHGRDVVGVPPERRDVNVVFQSYALFPHLSVADNIAFGLRMKRLPEAEIRGRVSEALRLVRLEGEATRLPRQISGGQQQRVALARALVNRPTLLLLDEPLSALDPSLRQTMQAELRRVQRETGITFLHITHDQAEALSLADRIAVMRAGRLEQVGPPRDVYERPASRFVAAFVGAANFFEGSVLGPRQVALDAGPVLTLPGNALPFSIGQRITLAVRPEDVTLAHSDAGGSLRGRIAHAAFRGADLEYSIALSNENGPALSTVRAFVPANSGSASLAEGTDVVMHVASTNWVVFPSGGRASTP